MVGATAREHWAIVKTISVVCRNLIIAIMGTACGIAAVTAATVAQAQQQPAGQEPAAQGQGKLPPAQFGPRAARPQAGGQPGQQRSRVPPPQVMGKFGDWVLQCEQTPQTAASTAGQDAAQETASTDDAPSGKGDAAKPDANGERPCGLVQTVRDEKRKNIGLTLVLLEGMQQGKKVTMMRVMAPIGVFLPTGVALEIDGSAVGRVPFTRCLPQVCIAFAEATPPTLEKLKKGGKANFIIYEAPGVGIRLPITLNGFSKALVELAKL
jgi:invasion protein IalB